MSGKIWFCRHVKKQKKEKKKSLDCFDLVAFAIEYLL